MKIRSLILATLIFCLPLSAQNFSAFRAFLANTVSSDIGLQENGSVQYHKITWATSGAPATCTVAIDSSPDGTSWTAGGIIAGQTCTSSGNSVITNASANFIRINLTALSGGTSPTVTINYTGWAVNPTGGSFTGALPSGTDSGVVNAYVVSNLSPAMGALVNGAAGCFVPANANTNGSPTVSFSGLTATTIAKNGSALANNDLLTTKLACMWYDATQNVFRLINPASVTGTGPAVQSTGPVFVTKASAPGFAVVGTTFTGNAGCSETTLVGGSTAGKFTAVSTSCTVILTLGGFTATNGFDCDAHDLTTLADVVNPHQTATTTTTVTIVTGTIVSGDVISFSCVPY